MDYIESDSSLFAWRTDSPLVVRFSGLPASVLTRLEFDAFAAVTEAVCLDEKLSAEGAALSGSLFDVIGGQAQPVLRPELVGLRRAVRQARPPAKREWNQPVADVLPGWLAARVGTWADSLAARRALRRELPAQLSAEAERKLATLREVAGAPSFRRALAQASRSLSDDLENWLADADQIPQRQKLNRITKYVTRAASKTSPYSTFALSGFAAWGAGRAPVTYAGQAPAEGVLELDGRYLQAMKNQLARLPELAHAVLVRVSPGAHIRTGTVEFIGHPPGEPLVSLQLTPAVQRCLAVLGGPGDVTRAALQRALEPAAGNGNPRAAERFLDRLAAAGLLEFYLPVADHAPEPVGELHSWLRASAGQAFPELAESLRQVSAQLTRRIPIEDVAAYRDRQAVLYRSLGELAQRLGLPPAMAGASSRPAVHEAAVTSQILATCSARRWRPALNDLEVVRRWLAIFDHRLPIRVAAGAYCRERFGAGASVPFSSLYRAVQEELARADSNGLTSARADLRTLLRGPEPWSVRLAGCQLARLRALGELRAAAVASVMPAGDAAGQLHVAPEALAQAVRAWPAWIKVPGSSACYVQVLESGDSFGLVLNVVHGGYGRGRSRLWYLNSRAGGQLPPFAPALAALGAHVAAAEIGGLLNSTLNVRVPAAPYEIDYPLTVSGRPPGQRLPLSDLLAVHDPTTDLVELTSARLGTRVMPLHLGMMANFQLPPAARFLERAFGTGYLMHPVAPPLIPVDTFSPPVEVRRYPRVSAGRIVIQRARWIINSARVPRRAAAEETADYIVRIAGWMRASGLPVRSFLRVGSGGFRGEGLKSRKPVYLDLANFHSALEFGQQAEASDLVILEEALPDPVHTASSGAADAHVAEFVIELTGGPDFNE